MNLRRYLQAVLLVFTGWAGSASAALMAPVTVNGVDWLQPKDFVNLNWNTIASVCDPITGLCTGSLGGNDVTGWTWASNDEAATLFNYYIGSIQVGSAGQYSEINSSWAPAFFADGWIRTEDFNSEFDVVLDAWTRTSLSVGGSPYGRIARMYDATNDRDVAGNDGAAGANNSYSWLGALFYGGEPVEPPPAAAPIPATLPLLGLGLVALGYSRRKRELYKLSI